MDVILVAELEEVLLREERVCLDLVRSGPYARLLDDGLDVVDREVGHADGAHFRLGERDHLLPNVRDGRFGRVHEDPALALGVVGQHVHARGTGLERAGPVDH